MSLFIFQHFFWLNRRLIDYALEFSIVAISHDEEFVQAKAEDYSQNDQSQYSTNQAWVSVTASDLERGRFPKLVDAHYFPFQF